MLGMLALFRSTIGQKVLMGTTGLMLVGFVVIHMIGNLLIFSHPGEDGVHPLDAYGHFLQHGTHGLIWVARLGLLGAVGVHIWSAVSLTRKNLKARGGRYAGGRKNAATTYAARTMRYGGMIIFLFIIYHLLHLTFGKLDGAGHGAFEYGEVYANVVTSFSQPVVAGVYIVAMAALALHLYHGIWSGLYTLGLSHPQYDTARRLLAAAVAVGVGIGNCSIPIAVLAGVIHL